MAALDGAPRHALDHYMPVSLYPFAGADLRNLPPMCDACNSRFKGTADILYDNDGNRRRCFDPYAGPVYEVSLTDSALCDAETGCALREPIWNIQFIGEPPVRADHDPGEPRVRWEGGDRGSALCSQGDSQFKEEHHGRRGRRALGRLGHRGSGDRGRPRLYHCCQHSFLPGDIV